MWKFLILICCGVIFGHFHFTSSTRTKRELDIMGALCVYGCIGEYLNHSALHARADNAGSIVCKHAEISQLESLCDSFKKGKECLKKECEDGPLVNMVLQAAEYGCETHFSDFQKYTPCFTSSCSYLENSCKPKCGTLHDAVQYTPEQKRKLAEIRKYSESARGESESSSTENDGMPISASDLKGLDILQNINLDGACGYINCFLNCSEAPLTEKCGSDTYKFFKRVVLDLVPMAFNGFFPNMTTPPDECKKTMEMSVESSPAAQSSWTLQAQSVLTVIMISLMIWFRSRN